MKTEKHCQRHGPMSHPYCVECYKDDLAKEKADDRLPSHALFGSWIPVSEKSPEMVNGEQIRVLVWDGGRHWTGRFWEEDGEYHCDECMVIPATHWMPLPSPPNSIISRIAGRDIRGCHLGKFGRGSLI